MKPQTQQSVRRAAARGPQEAGWPEQHRKSETAASPVIADRRDIAPSGPSAGPAASAEGYSGYVLVVTSQQTVISGPQGVQVKVVEVRMLVPVSEFLKQFPRKT
jgi:hypothetical protein